MIMGSVTGRININKPTFSERMGISEMPDKVLYFTGNSKQRRKQRRIYIKQYKFLKIQCLLEGRRVPKIVWANYNKPGYILHFPILFAHN